MINSNSHKYSVSAMCETLQIPRSNFYYDANIAVQKQQEKAAEEQILKKIVLRIFNENRQLFGTRKIKDGLSKAGYTVSKRRIGRFMKRAWNKVQVCTTVL